MVTSAEVPEQYLTSWCVGNHSSAERPPTGRTGRSYRNISKACQSSNNNKSSGATPDQNSLLNPPSPEALSTADSPLVLGNSSLREGASDPLRLWSSPTAPSALESSNLNPTNGVSNMEANVWEAASLLSPSMALPLALDQPLLFQGQQLPQEKCCSCLKTQLHCITEFSEHLDCEAIQLDTLLESARRNCEAISQHIACQECQKTSFWFILSTVALQRLIVMHCHVARNGPTYLRQTRVSIGVFQVPEDEDRIHKQRLVSSSASRMDAVVAELEKAVRDCQQRQQNSELSTFTAQSNLRWILETLQLMKRRLDTTMALLRREDWGIRDFPYDICR